MDIRGESSILQARDFQIKGSWIPTTPVKPSQAEPQPICADRKENQPMQANWSGAERFSELGQPSWVESEGISTGFSPETRTRGVAVAACCGSTNFGELNRGFDNWEAALPAESQLYGDNDSVCNKFSMDAMDRFNEMRFGDLLALAEAASATATSGNLNASANVNAANSSLISVVNSQIDDNRNEDILCGSNFQIYSDCAADIPHDRCSIPYQPSFDLNSPPRTTTDAFFSRSISSQFAPITPDHAKRSDNRMVSDIPNSTANERTSQAKDKRVNEIASNVVEVNELHQETEKSQLLEDQSGAAISTQLQENHNPDKGGNQDTDSNKTPQQKPRRKKHRPKVVIEGQSKSTRKPMTPKPADHNEIPTVKRKYTRRKGVDQPRDTPLAEETNKTNDSNTVRCTRKSCRRSLNFDSEHEVRDESSSCRPSSNFDTELHTKNFWTWVDQSRSNVLLAQGMEIRGEKTQAGIAYDLTCSMNLQEGNQLMPARQAPGPPTPAKVDLAQNKLMVDTHNGCIRGKCRIVFSDETHDKEASSAEMMKDSYSQSALRSPKNSKCSSGTCLTNGKQTRGLKRDHSCTADEVELNSTNEKGSHYNSMQAYLAMLPVSEYDIDNNAGMFFPTIYKKKRTEKAQNSATSSTSSTVTAAENRVGQTTIYSPNGTCTNPSTTEIGCRISDPKVNANSTLTAAIAFAQDKQHHFKCMLALGHTERLTKKRSKGPTRVRDVASLIRISKQFPTSTSRGTTSSGVMQGSEILHQPHTCMEALVADNHATKATKKRTKRSFLVSSDNRHRLLTESMGPPPDVIWDSLYSVDAIVERFRRLDINVEHNQVAGQEQNALIPYDNMRYRGQNALVLYLRDGTVVPFEGSLVPVKKRRPRAKVDLDDETNRVWKLLLEDINSEGIDGTDVDKAKWWEEERRVFHGRADSFIARMHLVQGDRRFSQWKGSVVDSCIGVFLTQNVSDHLSSSAFMSLAAHFPLKSKSNQGPPKEQRTGIFTEEPEVCVMDPEDTIGWHEHKSHRPDCDQGSMMVQDVESYEEKEVVSSNEASESSTSGIRSTYTSESKCLDSSKDSPDMYQKSAANRLATQIPRTVASSSGDQREMGRVFSPHNYVASSQESPDSSIAQTVERIGSCSQCNSEAELTAGSKSSSFGSSTSFVKLLQMAGTTMLHGVYNQGMRNTLSAYGKTQSEGMACVSQEQTNERSDGAKTSTRLIMPESNCSLHQIPDSGARGVECFDMLGEESRFFDISKEKVETCTREQSGFSEESASQSTVQRVITVSSQEAPKPFSDIDHPSNNLEVEVNKIFQSQKTAECPNNNVESQTQEKNCKMQQVLNVPNFLEDILNVTDSTSIIDSSTKAEHKAAESKGYALGRKVDGLNNDSSRAKRERAAKQKQKEVGWDSLRKQAEANGKKREKTANTMDSLDWEAVRCADVSEIAQTIKERGMNNMLAERIKDFLDRLIREHGSIDLEWLRDVPPDKAKEYLLSVRGLGLKSVECVRLLTLHHLAFPVDTNVGRIAVRLGWVPLQPLPESLQLHLLELYPVLESIQKYLWPRLCKLDQRTLYELHYQMITFGKVFCTKSKPNCNACPMRGECRHFASAFASARLALPAPEEKSIVRATESKEAGQNPVGIINPLQLLPPQANQQPEAQSEFSNCNPIIEVPPTPEPIIEVPATPEQEQTQVLESDIEDTFGEDPDEIPTIKLNIEEFTQNLQTYMQKNMELQEGDMSKALVALNPEAASIPTTKLKNVNRLRTEHQVYELPDSHPLLEGLEKREPDDPCSYLLAIWTPGETANSVQPPEKWCSSQESGKLCDEETCFSCNNIREANSQTVRGTLLIPCRTAMRGSFPLNGTYFQVNEVFADHESSLHPMEVPRAWIWNLPRRTVYFGTSIPTIFKGLSTEGIQYCFWRGFVCVRGFDQKTRAPRPLMARLHFPASKLTRNKGKTDENLTFIHSS
ncbi:unnamed protein product [Ilex paraguariensis]|uniref:HhH-GPD domain-containing protein n=1 Tax=Ilex paraguariensis TaxID=185542 RepID=A0ABC8TIZ3_9AQUA